MVLLDLLAKKPGLELVVAHFNHGIRPEAGRDEELVRVAASRLELRFEAGYGRLGKGASEALAREARYRFLETVQQKHRAHSIVTAHHQDDMLETAILNLLRGTGYRGLVAISANKRILRPLLSYTKEEILAYAGKHDLEWHEDSTNLDDAYLRNYVRLKLLPRLAAPERKELICNIDKVAEIEKSLNHQIAKLSQDINEHSVIDRRKFTSLPIELSNELLVYWLRSLTHSEFDRKTVNRINMALRTAKAGTSQPVRDDLKLVFKRRAAQFTNSL